jgi:hypothetical protein
LDRTAAPDKSLEGGPAHRRLRRERSLALAGLESPDFQGGAMIELWLWEVPDPRTGRWRRTRYRMTEPDARARYGSEARKIDASREVRMVAPDGASGAGPRKSLKQI